MVLSYFGTLGSLIVYGILDEGAAVSTLGFRGDHLWTELEPFISREREIREDDDFAKFFEDFVCRVRANWPPEKNYGLTIRRLPQP
jgi:hypothetical protein